MLDLTLGYLRNSSLAPTTLLAEAIWELAPSRAGHLSHSCVAALEKGTTIVSELRLAVNQMTNSYVAFASYSTPVTIY